MDNKSLPLDKTAVLEFKLSIVDSVRRTRYMAESMASRLPRTTPFQSGDQSVTDVIPLVLNGITTLVMVYSFESLLLDITKGAETIHGIQCSGLFMLSGSIDQIVVKSPTVGHESRVTFAFA